MLSENSYQKTVINESSLPHYSMFPNFNTLLITATLGIGKTENLYAFLKRTLNTHYKSCLIVTFRKTLCQKYAQDLHQFTLYSDLHGKISPDSFPFVIMQIDSIKRIRDSYDLVIFDEITYAFEHLVTSAINKKRCFDVIEQLFYDNNHIICMDALLNDEWANYIKSFKNRVIKHIVNEYSLHNDKRIINYGLNKVDFINKIKLCINNNENIVIASNNKKILRFINNEIENYKKNIKKLFIMKESKTKYDLEQWKKVQVLAYSPTIVAGISFTEKHYDRIFGIFCNTSASAEMAMQQLFRVRNLKKNEINLCFDITGKNDYPETEEGVKELIINEDKCLVGELENISINYIKQDIIEDNYFNLFKLIQLQKFKSNNNYMKSLIKLLNSQGIKKIKNIIDKVDINDKKTLNKKKREFNKLIEYAEASRIVKANNRTEEEIEEIKNKFDKTEDDIYEIKKHKFTSIFQISSDMLTENMYIKYNKSAKPLYNIAYVYGSGDEFIEKINKRLNYIEKKYDTLDNTIRLGRDKKYEKIVICDHMVKYFGFNSIFDNKNINIDKEKFKQYIYKYHHILEKLFKCNKFNFDIFNENKWYQKCKQYINAKLNSVFKIRIVEDRKTKMQCIKGLDFWCEKISYKNPLIINDIKNTEKQIYEEVEMEEKINKFKENGLDNFDAIINALLDNEVIENKCIICKEETIFGNKYCIKHKMELKN